jgi:hypothetical protein
VESINEERDRKRYQCNTGELPAARWLTEGSRSEKAEAERPATKQR